MENNSDNNNPVKVEWNKMHDAVLSGACDLLNGYEYNALDYLAEMVASICDVNVDDIFEKCQKSQVSHARWFFWYAYRYMTHESYEKIAEKSSRRGHKFTMSAVQNAIKMMTMMASGESVWVKRWDVIKNIIQSRNDSACANDCLVVTIQVPKELSGRVRVELKEKQ